MTKRVGRNDPCPCGSGRKYKKCCQADANEADFHYRRWRSLEARLIPQLLSFVMNTIGPETISEAWSEFYDGEPEEEYDPEAPMNMVFMPWFLFNWIHEASALGVPYFTKTTIAISFLSEFELSSDEEKFLINTSFAPYSLCEIVEVTPGVGLTLFDLFRCFKYEVIERSASHTLKKGEIIYCATTDVEGLKSNVGTGPYALPPTAKRDILAMRKWIIDETGYTEINAETLDDFEPDIRRFYLQSVKAMFRPPQLTNTDKDPFLPQKIYFNIASAERAFHALKDLAVGVSEERLRADTTLQDDVIVTAEIDWLGGTEEARKRLGGPVLLGNIRIDHQKLIVDVNSSKRAETIRQIIEARLGAEVVYKTTLLEPIESEVEKMWAAAAAMRASSSSPEADQPNNTEGGGLLSPIDMSPELRSVLEANARRHWVEWLDLPVPALNDMTPREATKTEEGRDLLESLLLYYENNTADESHENLMRPDIPALRHQLGID